MKVKKALIWSHLNTDPHPCLTPAEKQIAGSMGLVAHVFPGINYYSMTGFAMVREQYLVPALRKLFPDLASVPAEEIKDSDMVEVTQFLSSKGYEWQDSEQWRKNFQKKLAA